jgi:hypothetical protein
MQRDAIVKEPPLLVGGDVGLVVAAPNNDDRLIVILKSSIS